MSSTSQRSGIGPGWYLDPRNPEAVRWWDGSAWTGHVRPKPSEDAGTEPAAAVAAPTGQQSDEPPTRPPAGKRFKGLPTPCPDCGHVNSHIEPTCGGCGRVLAVDGASCPKCSTDAAEVEVMPVESRRTRRFVVLEVLLVVVGVAVAILAVSFEMPWGVLLGVLALAMALGLDMRGRRLVPYVACPQCGTQFPAAGKLTAAPTPPGGTGASDELGPGIGWGRD